MSKNEAELTSQTLATVVEGLGYPNGRVEVSPTPTGWMGHEQTETVNVSRETLPEKPE